MPTLDMPHALKFFRHSNSFDLNQKRPDKKTIRSFSGQGNRPSVGDRTISTSSQNSTESNGEMKRISIYSSPKSSQKHVPQYVPAKVSMLIESPPLVFIGNSQSSSGALLSGLLQLKIAEEKMMIKSIQLKLVISIRQKKPFHQHCPECANQNVDLKVWDFFPSEKEFLKGDHDIPFSHMLAGHLPITMHGSLSVIDYVLKAVVTLASGQPLFLQRELNVKRAIAPSEMPKQSIRIFPPTNLTAHVELPQVAHPIGEFLCQFRLDGVIKRNTDTAMQTHWKLKRLTWRLEETQKVVSPACPKHALKAGATDGAKKGMAHSETRLLNSDETKTGWKCDYSAGASGSIEMQFPFSLTGSNGLEPLCDVKAENGTEVSHALVVEMIVAEEFAPIKKPNQVTPTGAARVLRMHFNVTVTERMGLGISWDEEQPPLYDDVPASPPRYAFGRSGRPTGSENHSPAPGVSSGHGQVEVYNGTPITDLHGTPIPTYEELEGIEHLDLNGGLARPSPLHESSNALSNSHGMWQPGPSGSS